MLFYLGELKEISEVLQTLMKKELPIRLAWNLNKIVVKVLAELYEMEKFRIDLVKKYGTEVEDKIVVTEENEQEFHTKIMELYQQEIELDVEPVSILEFSSDIRLTLEQMQALTKIFKD